MTAPLLVLVFVASGPGCGGRNEDEDGSGGVDSGSGGTADSDAAAGSDDASTADGAVTSNQDASAELDASAFVCTPIGVSASTCGSGSGTVASAVPGVTVDPVVSAWYQDFGSENCTSGIFIDERASNCDPQSVVDELGHFVSIFFCNPPSVGEYTVVHPVLKADHCPEERVVSIIVQDEEFEDDVQAMSGTVTIDSIDGCLTGSFTAATELDEELSGSFAAYTCP